MSDILQYTISDDGIESLAFNGVEYISAPWDAILGATRFRLAGVDTDYAYKPITDATTKSHTANSFTHLYTLAGATTITATIALSRLDRRTLRVDYTFTNNDPVRSLARIATGFKYTCPDVITRRSDGSIFPVRMGAVAQNAIPAFMIGGAWGSIAHWPGSVANNGKIYIESITELMQLVITSYTPSPDNGDPIELYDEDVIPPLGSWRHSLYLRFGSANDVELPHVVPEAMASARSAFSPILHWTNRNPIGLLFIAAHPASSVTNPRGYLNSSGLDVSDTEAFRAAVIAWTQDKMTNIVGPMTPKPQAVIVWNLEGEQFNEFTYGGCPDQLAIVAPEMDLVADDLFRIIRAAGVLPGVTIRPDNVDPIAPHSHTQVTTQAAAYAILKAKIRYAYNRWHCRVFYIDSPGVASPDRVLGPGVLRDLRKDFPDILIIPEVTPPLGTCVAADYKDSRFESMTTGRQINRRELCCVAPDYTLLSNPVNYTTAVQSVRDGNIFFFSAFWFDPVNPIVSSIYADARG